MNTHEHKKVEYKKIIFPYCLHTFFLLIISLKINKINDAAIYSKCILLKSIW